MENLCAELIHGCRPTISPIHYSAFGMGTSSQYPTPRQIIPESRKCRPRPFSPVSHHGFDQQITTVAFRNDRFYNELDDLVVGREDRFVLRVPPIGPFDTQPYANAGRGEVYGANKFRYDGTNTLALLAVTVSRSLRTEMERLKCSPSISPSF